MSTSSPGGPGGGGRFPIIGDDTRQALRITHNQWLAGGTFPLTSPGGTDAQLPPQSGPGDLHYEGLGEPGQNGGQPGDHIVTVVHVDDDGREVPEGFAARDAAQPEPEPEPPPYGLQPAPLTGPHSGPQTGQEPGQEPWAMGPPRSARTAVGGRNAAADISSAGRGFGRELMAAIAGIAVSVLILGGAAIALLAVLYLILR
jgi:hypothetical protein